MLSLAERPDDKTRAAGGRRAAVVIGAGFGGLAAAVRLGARGYEATVLDRRETPGGRACVHRQDGFVFDAGPTIITAPFLFEELWALAGRRLADDVTLKTLDPFYDIVFDGGERLSVSGDPARMRAAIAALAPGDVEGFERFMRHSERLYRVGFEQLGHVPFGSWRDMARAAPDLMRLGGFHSVYGLVSGYVRDPRVRFALSFHPLFVGGDPFATTSVYCLISHLERRFGVHFAMGGTGALVEGLVSLIRGQGGAVRLGAHVEEIVVEAGRARGVRLAGGETVAADIVVSNADAAMTYLKLVPPSARRPATTLRLSRARQSMGVFVWYFGTRRRFEGVPHHTILLGPRYRGLIKDIFRAKRLADDMSLYLHRPTATDPSLAPAGCDAFYVLAPVPNLDAGVDWTLEAEPYRRRVARRLAETVLPDFERDIVTSRVTTPLDFERDLCAMKGAAFGLEPILSQSAWFRPHNESEDVRGLYLVGAGTHPGAGVPGVLSSAKVLDKVVPHATELAPA
jgi:phytoene desaturase